MTATTSPDGIRYPNDPNAPADSIAAFTQLATDTQTSLNRRMTAATTVAQCTRDAGWDGDATGYGYPTVEKTGRLIVARGLYVRITTLTVTDNSGIKIGTVPAGYRPAQSLRCPVPWVGTSSGNSNVSTGMLTVYTVGDLYFYPNFSGTMAVDQWISLAGLAWLTP